MICRIFCIVCIFVVNRLIYAKIIRFDRLERLPFGRVANVIDIARFRRRWRHHTIDDMREPMRLRSRSIEMPEIEHSRVIAHVINRAIFRKIGRKLRFPRIRQARPFPSIARSMGGEDEQIALFCHRVEYRCHNLPAPSVDIVDLLVGGTSINTLFIVAPEAAAIDNCRFIALFDPIQSFVVDGYRTYMSCIGHLAHEPRFHIVDEKPVVRAIAIFDDRLNEIQLSII